MLEINLSTELCPADKRLAQKISAIDEVAGVQPSDGADDRFMPASRRPDAGPDTGRRTFTASR